MEGCSPGRMKAGWKTKTHTEEQEKSRLRVSMSHFARECACGAGALDLPEDSAHEKYQLNLQTCAKTYENEPLQRT